MGGNQLAALLGSDNAERASTYIVSRSEGDSREIADTVAVPNTPSRGPLERRQQGGLFLGKGVGRSPVYQMNSQFVFGAEREQHI
jgi:NAD(P)H-flavin reductase